MSVYAACAEVVVQFVAGGTGVRSPTVREGSDSLAAFPDGRASDTLALVLPAATCKLLRYSYIKVAAWAKDPITHK